MRKRLATNEPGSSLSKIVIDCRHCAGLGPQWMLKAQISKSVAFLSLGPPAQALGVVQHPKPYWCVVFRSRPAPPSVSRPTPSTCQRISGRSAGPQLAARCNRTEVCMYVYTHVCDRSIPDPADIHACLPTSYLPADRPRTAHRQTDIHA